MHRYAECARVALRVACTRELKPGGEGRGHTHDSHGHGGAGSERQRSARSAVTGVRDGLGHVRGSER